MNIYLAGKMSDKGGSWRNAILGEGSWVYGKADLPLPNGKQSWCHPHWILSQWSPMGRCGTRTPQDDWDDEFPVREWPVWRGIVLNHHDYAGPYRQDLPADVPGKWTGEFHGVEARGQHGMMDDADQRLVVENVRRAIRRSDLVFAYLNDPEAHGTLAEVGYAAALGKFIAVVVNEEQVFDSSEFWFVGQLGNRFTDFGAWDLERQSEADLLRGALKEAIIAFTARRDRSGQAIEDCRKAGHPSEPLIRAFESFQNISRWSADPRVRMEAERMLGVLSASVRG